jgi:hypothetical protein
MKVFAVLTMWFALITGCVAAENEAPETAPVAAEAVLTEQSAEGVVTAEAAALLAPITINGFCEDQHALCTPDCLELVGNAKGACLRRCQREYEECTGG